MDALHCSSSASSDTGSSPMKCGKLIPKGFWFSEVRETLFSSGRDGLLHVTILGGSEHDSFCYISDADEERLNLHSGRLHRDDIILEIQGENVAGFTRQDLLDWLWSVSRNHSPVLMKTVSSAFLTKSLSKFLTLRFLKDSVDQSLQQIIRKNVYRKALPCTTRSARQGELDGVDYKFLTVDEFLSLEKSGGLLESGIYNGNYYGTPKPQVPVHPRGKPYTGQSSSSSSCQVEHIDRTSQEQQQGLPISSFSNTIRDEEEDDYEEEAGDKSSSAVGSASQRTSVGNGMTTDITVSNRLRHSFGEPNLHTQLPYGWEKVIDPDYGVYYIDHINRKTQYDFPVALSCSSADAAVSSTIEVENMKENNIEKENRNSSSGTLRSPHGADSGHASCNRRCLSRNNIELKGDFIKTQLMKSTRGLGFTIVSTDDSDVELLQIKTILPNGSADIDGRLQRGDVLVYVDSHCVVGFTHQDVITLFQSIPIGNRVALEVCRGYPLPFDPDDPSTEVITTVAVSLPANRSPPLTPAAQHYVCGRSASGDTGTGHLPLIPMPSPPPLSCRHSLLHQQLPPLGVPGEKMPKCSSRDADKRIDCGPSVGLTELTAVVVKGCDGFGFTIADSSVGQRIKQVLDHDRCQSLSEGDVITEINGLNVRNFAHADVVELLKNCPTDTEAVLVIQRGGGGHSLRRRRQSSRTRPSKDDSASTTIVNTSSAEVPVTANRNEDERGNSGSLLNVSQSSDFETNKIIPLLSHSHLHQSLRSPCHKERRSDSAVDKQIKRNADANSENVLLANQCISGTPDFITASAFHNPLADPKHDQISGHNLTIEKKCNTDSRCPYSISSSKRGIPFPGDPSCASCKVEFGDRLTNEAMRMRNIEGPTSGSSEFLSTGGHPSLVQDGNRWTVRLERQESGFGIRIVGGIEEGSQVAIGYIVPDGAADVEGHLEVGDEILAVNQQSVIGASHHQVVSLMSQSARLGFVVLHVCKRESSLHRKTISGPTRNLFDVALTRKDGEGFGFVIVSSVTKAGSIVGKILDGSPAGRCEQLQVGDSILAINSIDIANMTHQEIVNFIKASGLSIVLTVSPVTNSASANRSDQMQNQPHSQTEFFHLIELRRGSRGFGFSIRGGKEFDGMPLYVLKIADEGPAEIDGRLQVGDQIVEIDGCNTVDIQHTEAIDIIQNSGTTLSLLIKRSANSQHIAIPREHSPAIPTEALNQNSENMMRSARNESQKQTTKVKKPKNECH